MAIESNKSASSQRMLNVKQVASSLSVHPGTVRRWERGGLLKAYRIGPRGNVRFAKSDIIHFVCKPRQEVPMKMDKQ
jgi:excisionase family DNA binding protein